VALIIPRQVLKQLQALPRAEAKQLLERLEAVAEAPLRDHPNIRPLTGAPGSFRLRQGDWRAVFSLEDGDVVLDRIAHRREVYR
jgi:mRNA interferase RelE/StbE